MMLNVGLIGCGNHITNAHVLPANGLDCLQFSHVFDSSPTSIFNFEEKTQIQAQSYATQQDLIRDSGVQAIFIGSPDNFHADALLDCIRGKVHTLVEKPLATSLSDLHSVANALQVARSEGLFILTCHPKRFDPPCVTLAENLKIFQETLGTLRAFNFSFEYPRAISGWRRDRNLVVDHASHEIDLMDFVLGPAGLEAKLQSVSDRQYVIQGERFDGVKFLFSGVCSDGVKKPSESIKLNFDNGEVRLNPLTGAYCYSSETDHRQTLPSSVAPSNYLIRSLEVTKNFVRAINGMEEPYLSFDRMLLNTEFALALAENGKFASSLEIK